MKCCIINIQPSGGIPQYCVQLVNKLSKYINVSIILDPSNTEIENYNKGVQKEFVEFRKKPGKPNLSGLFQLKNTISKIDPEVVHFINFNIWYGIISLFINKPIVATLHNPIPHSHARKTHKNMAEIIKNALLFNSSRIIIHGPRTKSQAKQVGLSSHKLKIIPHGIYDKYLDWEDKVNTTEELKNQVLLFGHIRPNKGYDRLPKIASMVKKEVPDVKFIVAGQSRSSTGKLRISKETMDQLKSNERIKLIDRYIPNEEVAKLFQQSKILLLPYHDATQSGVALIGYALEVPMVATDTGDMGWMIQKDNSGLLADPKSDEEIAENVIMLLKNDSLIKKIKENIKKKKHQYSWEEIAKSTVDLYYDVLKEN